MEIKRDIHLKRLIASQHDGMVKVVTGVRRCGKSYLLFTIPQSWLILSIR
jgi:predicted AAA+ superfamily ATPase